MKPRDFLIVGRESNAPLYLVDTEGYDTEQEASINAMTWAAERPRREAWVVRVGYGCQSEITVRSHSEQ